MSDPGDEHDESREHFRERRTTDPEITQPATVPEPADPWVTNPRMPPEAPPPPAKDPATRFLSMAFRLLAASRALLSVGIELQTGRLEWTEELRRDWGGRLRRMGLDLDAFIGSQLP